MPVCVYLFIIPSEVITNLQKKISLIKSNHPKKYLPNFPFSYPKKIREEKNSNPEKIRPSSPSLKIQSTPHPHSPSRDKGTQECLMPSGVRNTFNPWICEKTRNFLYFGHPSKPLALMQAPHQGFLDNFELLSRRINYPLRSNETKLKARFE